MMNQWMFVLNTTKKQGDDRWSENFDLQWPLTTTLNRDKTKHCVAVVSWAPKKKKINSPPQFLEAQQLNLHLECSKFQ